MIDIEPKIHDLMPDFHNPRIGNATTKLEAMGRIVSLQGEKLFNLAQDIVNNGLSPIDRLLVIKEAAFPEHFVVVEGNRRATALILLSNPILINSLEVFSTSAAMKRLQTKLRDLSDRFDKASCEPLKVVLAPSRQSTQHWVQLRHSGEADGVGVTRWKYIESQRFADPKARIVVAADFLYQHGALSELEKEMLDDLAWSTFDRFIDSPRLREVFGVDFREGKVVTRASKERVATAFREVAFRISRGELNSRKNNGVDERLAALRDLPSGVLPPIIDEGDVLEDANETSAVPSVPVAESVRTPRKADPVPRDRLFKKSDFNVTEKRESQVFKELCDLPVSNKPNACAVLLRVFLEMSVLHYLTKAGIGTGGGKGRPYAELDILFERAYLQMQKQEPGLVLPGIDAMLVARTTVLRMRELHSYVHNRHIFPAPADLQAFASELTQFIKKIWP